MQEESFLLIGQISTADNINSSKMQKKQTNSWISRFFFNCCKPVSPPTLTYPTTLKKSASAATTHYSNAGPTSFANLSTPILSAVNNSPASLFPLETAFLLGKGTNKIISKISKVELGVKSPLASGIMKSPYRAVSQFDSKKQEKELLKISNGNAKNERDVSGNIKLTPFEIFSMYAQNLQVEKSHWVEMTPEYIAKYVAEKLNNQLIIDAFCGCGVNIVQVSLFMRSFDQRLISIIFSSLRSVLLM